MSEHLVGASVWEQEIYDHVTEHVSTEGRLLDEYQRLAQDESMSPAFRYLANLIIEDERRHHKYFNELAESIRMAAELRVQDAPIPLLGSLRKDRERVLEATERLLEAERQDARDLKALAKQMRDVRDTTLWVLLVDLMEHDTEKHMKILRFVKEHSK